MKFAVTVSSGFCQVSRQSLFFGSNITCRLVRARVNDRLHPPVHHRNCSWESLRREA